MNMSKWMSLTVTSGLWSGVLSAVALVAASRSRGDGAATGLNGPSHWFFEEHVVHDQRPSLRHTLVGVATHQASSFFWGLWFAALRCRPRAQAHDRRRIAAEAAALTALAASVDLAVVPRRLTPGFERRLAAGALAGVYGAFALGLLIAAARERRGDPASCEVSKAARPVDWPQRTSAP